MILELEKIFATITKLAQEYVYQTNEKINDLEAALMAVRQERDELRRKLESGYASTLDVTEPGLLELARRQIGRERERLSSITKHGEICEAIESILDYLEKK